MELLSFCNSVAHTCDKCHGAILPMTRYWKESGEDGKRYHPRCVPKRRPVVHGVSEKRREEVTEEKIQKAIAKAVSAETKRCIAAVKSVDAESAKNHKTVVKMAIEAIKSAE